MNTQTVSAPKRVVVRMAEWATSDNIHEELVTYSLGSCIAVSLYDPEVQIGGIIHILLPNSSIDPKKAARLPGLFVDTGIPQLFNAVCQMGANKSRLQIKVAGGADMIVGTGAFSVGDRNCKALAQLLEKQNLKTCAEAVRGHISRTFRLIIATGEAIVETPGKENVIL